MALVTDGHWYIRFRRVPFCLPCFLICTWTRWVRSSGGTVSSVGDCSLKIRWGLRARGADYQFQDVYQPQSFLDKRVLAMIWSWLQPVCTIAMLALWGWPWRWLNNCEWKKMLLLVKSWVNLISIKWLLFCRNLLPERPALLICSR